MAVKEPGWILEAPGKRKMEIKGENGDDNRKRIETQKLQTKNIYLHNLHNGLHIIIINPHESIRLICVTFWYKAKVYCGSRQSGVFPLLSSDSS